MRVSVVIFISIFVWALTMFQNQFENQQGKSEQKVSLQKNEKLTQKRVNLFPADFGNPYMNHYKFEQKDIQIWAISQVATGEMILAHRQGIVVFDGKTEEQVKVPSIPIILKSFEEQNLTFLGCDDEYGYLKKNRQGLYEYHVLSVKSAVKSEITDIKITDKYIYFYSEKSIFRHKKENLEFDNSWHTLNNEIQNGIIQKDNEIFVSIRNRGLYKFNTDGKRAFIPKSYTLSQEQIAFSFPLDKKRLIIGTYENNFYTFNGNRIEVFSTMAQKYIYDSQLTGGIDLTEDVFAVSTITGGSIILSKKDGDVVNILDIKSGLPDNEIYALGKDRQGGLWLSHGFGMSRVNYNLPVRDFNKYQGIEGNIIDVVVVDNRTYIATNQGVYYQDSTIQLKSNEKIKGKNLKIKKSNTSTESILNNETGLKQETTQDKTEVKDAQPEKNSKKSLYQKWKENREEKKKKRAAKLKNETGISENKKTITKEPVKEEIEKTEIKTNETEKDTEEKERKKTDTDNTNAKVWSVNYVFKKIKNINGKCRQLIKYEDMILVASNNGLYEINDKSSKIILKRNYINFVLPSKTAGVYYIGTDRGITAIRREKNKWVEYPKVQPKGFEAPVYTIAEDENQNLWVGNDNEVLYFVLGKNLSTISFESYDFGNEYTEKFSIRQIDNSIYFLSSGQIYRFNTSSNKIEPTNQLITNKFLLQKYIVSQNNLTWLQNGKEWNCISGRFKPNKLQLALLNLFENIQNIYVDDYNNLWVVDGKNNLYKILYNHNLDENKENFKVYLKNITDDYGNYAILDNIKIPAEISSLKFTISAPYYLNSSGTTYQYMIKGIMNGWSDWNPNHEFPFIVQPGNYKVQVRAKNILGEICTSPEYRLVVKYPFWTENWFIVLVTVLTMMILTSFIILLQKKRERRLQRDNKRLEAKVEERTQEIVKQKEQIESKNREITDSLNYASQIQSAILPPVDKLKESLGDYFVFNMPKDIVSGDFYWFNKVNGQLVITAADCTGHGVPGAFLSLLGVTYLNEITSKMEILRANLILEFLRERVINSLNQGGYNRKRLDGIDMSLVIIDLSKMELQFAGANNSIYLIRNGYLSEFKGNRMPIGLHAHKHIPFTNHDIEIKKGDLVYLFSDGFFDQFGGDYGRKFLSRNFKTLLTEIFHLDMQEQCNILRDVLESWKISYEQIDDILVIGLKI